jgi:hypothetical protein
LFCCIPLAFGQLTSNNADALVRTAYGGNNPDTIFVFNNVTHGNLFLEMEEPCDFEWYKFDYNDLDFKLFDTETNVSKTEQNSLTTGGYKVTAKIISSGEDTTFFAWIYINPGFEFKMRKEFLNQDKSCENTLFYMDTNTVSDRFTYYNPTSTLPLPLHTLENPIRYYVSRQNPTTYTTITFITQGVQAFWRDWSPPDEDMDFHFKAEDRFGIVHEDVVFYATVIPKVEIVAPTIPSPASSPLTLKFESRPNTISDQHYEYFWNFGNGDSILITQSNMEVPETTYYITDPPFRRPEYTVKLIVTSRHGCIDSVSTIVRLDAPALSAGNVFVPKSDNPSNRYFKPDIVSLRHFEISIFTRTGYQVHYHKGVDWEAYEGWDGKVRNTGQYATQGVYYYTIKAIGWDSAATTNPRNSDGAQDNSQSDGLPYRGFIHVY